MPADQHSNQFSRWPKSLLRGDARWFLTELRQCNGWNEAQIPRRRSLLSSEPQNRLHSPWRMIPDTKSFRMTLQVWATSCSISFVWSSKSASNMYVPSSTSSPTLESKLYQIAYWRASLARLKHFQWIFLQSASCTYACCRHCHLNLIVVSASPSCLVVFLRRRHSQLPPPLKTVNRCHHHRMPLSPPPLNAFSILPHQHRRCRHHHQHCRTQSHQLPKREATAAPPPENQWQH